jgi:iron(III) transport system ATP-binding protein
VLDQIVKRYGSFVAVNNASLAVYRNEFVCFVGPSGCGKTTLLRAIAGLDIQSEGRIFQNGEDISSLPTPQRDFGIVFQSYALFPNLNVNRNVSYGLQGKKIGKKQIQAKVDGLLQTVGLLSEREKFPAQLSGGQQQRVALARALATSPGLLLLDEPLSALDAKVRQHLRVELKELQRQLSVTTIMVTHDQEEALSVADRIVVMDSGAIVQVGTPQEVYREPVNAFVADFIGEMNFIPARLGSGNQITIGKSLTCHITPQAHSPGAVVSKTAGDTSDRELASDHAGLGQDVLAAIRPEDVQLLEVDANATNSFQAFIQSSEFLGSYTRAHITAPELGDAVIRADLSMNRVRKYNIKTGETVPAALPAERIRVYPRS